MPRFNQFRSRRRPPIGRSRPVAVGLVLALMLAIVGPQLVAAAATPATTERRLTVSYGDQQWQFSGEPDSAGLGLFVERIAQGLNRPPADAQLQQTATRYRLQPAQQGREVDVVQLTARIEQALRMGEADPAAVTVPVRETPPRITTEALLKQLGITTTLATGDSDFAGSEPGRATNVRVAAKIVDGTLVPPGGVFSYNYALGPIVDDPGFVVAAAAEGGVPGTALGGGVCQISTTVFRAALRAGLPITEWWPHAFRYPYYERDGWGPGFDASIVQPDAAPLTGGDLKFVNPTASWMLVRISLKGTRVNVELDGAPTGYHVEIDKPIYSNQVSATGAAPMLEVDSQLPSGTEQTADAASDGLTVTVVRHVTDAVGNPISTDTFVTMYQPRGAIMFVSPDRAGLAAVPPVP